MKFIISTQELNQLLSKCLNVVPLKPTMPILANVHIKAGNDELEFTATDLTLGVCCFTEAKIIEEGATTVPLRRFSQLCKELTALNVEVNSNAQEIMEISANSSRFKLNGLSKNEYPSLPVLDDALKLSVEQFQLKEVLYRTSFAVSREDNRYVLTGVSMTVRNGVATFVGTDGKKLARAQMNVNCDPSLNAHYIIPLKAVEEMQKNLRDDGQANIFLMKDKIAVQANQTTLVSKLLTGDYPDIDKVIPSSAGANVLLHREELISLLRQIVLFTSEERHSVRFTLSDSELELTANSKEIGEGKVSMPANYHGEKLEIAFDPHFFLDILRHSKNETIMLSITDGYTPGIITEREESDDISSSSPLFVLMPLRLNDE